MTRGVDANRGFGRKLTKIKRIVAQLSGLASVGSLAAVIYKLYEAKPADITRSVTVQSIWTYSSVDLIAISSVLFYIVGLLLIAWALVGIPGSVGRQDRRPGSIILYLVVLAVWIIIGYTATYRLFYRTIFDYGQARAYFFDHTLPKAELSDFLFRAEQELAGGDLDRAKIYFDQAIEKFGNNAAIQQRATSVGARIVYAEKMHAWADELRKRGPHMPRELELEAESVTILPTRAAFRIGLEQTLSAIEEARAQWPAIATLCARRNWNEAIRQIGAYGWYFLERSQIGNFRNDEAGRRMLLDTCRSDGTDPVPQQTSSIVVEDVSFHPSLLSRADARWNYAAAKEIVREAQPERLEAAKDRFATSANERLQASRPANIRFVFGVLMSRMRVVDVIGLQRRQATAKLTPAVQPQLADEAPRAAEAPVAPVTETPGVPAPPNDPDTSVATVEIRADGVPVVSPPKSPIRVRALNPGGMKTEGAENDVFSGPPRLGPAGGGPP